MQTQVWPISVSYTHLDVYKRQVPDTVHILSKGKIVKTGGPELALELEQNGYRDYVTEAA